MNRNQRYVPVYGLIIIILILVNAVILREAFTGSGKWYWALLLTVPLLLLAIKKSTTIDVTIKLKYHEEIK